MGLTTILKWVLKGKLQENSQLPQTIYIKSCKLHIHMLDKPYLEPHYHSNQKLQVNTSNDGALMYRSAWTSNAYLEANCKTMQPLMGHERIKIQLWIPKIHHTGSSAGLLQDKIHSTRFSTAGAQPLSPRFYTTEVQLLSTSFSTAQQ